MSSDSFQVCDNDRKYSRGYDKVLKKRMSPLSRLLLAPPNQNAFVERWIGSIKGECFTPWLFACGSL